jgi:CBS domain-containing protein
VPESKDLLAKEVMIPLSRYPHIEESATLEDAIEAICNFTVPLDDGVVVPPRYVLVFDTNNTLKGILSRRDILRGLAPGYLNVKHALEQTPYGMPGMFDGFEQGFAWNSLFSPGALQNARNPVKGLMLLPAALVSIHDTVGTVVGAMLEHKVDLVPVLDGGRVVGLVLMTEIFEYVARYVLDHGTGPGASNRN